MSRKRDNPEVKQFCILVSRVGLQTCKAYADKTGQLISEVLGPEITNFNNAILEKSRQIQDLEFAALKQNLGLIEQSGEVMPQ